MLGAGAMAEAFIKGITEKRVVEPRCIRVLNRRQADRLAALADLYGVTPATSIADAAGADVIVLSVKPYDVAEALQALSPYLHGQTLISFAAGIPLAFLEKVTEGRAQVIRTMPNVPVAVLQGAIAMAYGPSVTADKVEHAKHLLTQIGIVVELDASLMYAATAVSGSGQGLVRNFM